MLSSVKTPPNDIVRFLLLNHPTEMGFHKIAGQFEREREEHFIDAINNKYKVSIRSKLLTNKESGTNK